MTDPPRCRICKRNDANRVKCQVCNTCHTAVNRYADMTRAQLDKVERDAYIKLYRVQIARGTAVEFGILKQQLADLT